jgi:hypothetical protein
VFIAAYLLVCCVHFKISLVVPSVSCLQDLVFLAGIFVLACCESGFSCRDSYCCFSLICWPVSWFGPVLHLCFSPFLLRIINPAPGAASARQGSNFLCPDPARVFHCWCSVSMPNSLGPIFFAVFSDRGSCLSPVLASHFFLILRSGSSLIATCFNISCGSLDGLCGLAQPATVPLLWSVLSFLDICLFSLQLCLWSSCVHWNTCEIVSISRRGEDSCRWPLVLFLSRRRQRLKLFRFLLHS